MLRPPFSSEYDPSQEAEGSIDPLGLAPGYERLADRLLPAVTIRMGRPRFVTTMAIGACICETWDSDDVAADGITPAWLVFEWFVVEAFVREQKLLAEQGGIPGAQKIQRALSNNRPVNAIAYLKTPGTFGFTGVFRRLAHDIGILTESGRLDEGGYELVTAWAKDQGLEGIIDASSGEGHDWRTRMRRAVSQGMEKGQTTRQAPEFWRDLTRRLDPARPGPKEARILLRRILSHSGPMEMIAQVADALVGQRGVSSRDEEAPFLRTLGDRAPTDLRQLLTAIDAYEAFGRSITDAFDGLRYCASINGGAPVNAKAFSAVESVGTSFATLQPSLDRMRAHPELLEWQRDRTDLVQAMDRFTGVRNSDDLFDAVLTHHRHVQETKHKRAWFEDAPGGKVVVRSGYSLHEPPEEPGTYVHEYRIPTFSRFLADLGAFR